MIYIQRSVEDFFSDLVRPQKVLIILGARRVGKTQLINHKLLMGNKPHLLLNGEDMNAQAILANRSVSNYRRLLGDK